MSWLWEAGSKPCSKSLFTVKVRVVGNAGSSRPKRRRFSARRGWARQHQKKATTEGNAKLDEKVALFTICFLSLLTFYSLSDLASYLPKKDTRKYDVVLRTIVACSSLSSSSCSFSSDTSTMMIQKQVTCSTCLPIIACQHDTCLHVLTWVYSRDKPL